LCFFFVVKSREIVLLFNNANNVFTLHGFEWLRGRNDELRWKWQTAFVYVNLFYLTTLVSSSDCTALNVRMMSEFEEMWEGTIWPILGYAVL
jgi:hypothetical protein